jgi:hypothetical protein
MLEVVASSYDEQDIICGPMLLALRAATVNFGLVRREGVKGVFPFPKGVAEKGNTTFSLKGELGWRKIAVSVYDGVRSQ